MPYLGNTPTTQSFISGTDYFNGTGAQTAFTLSRTVASVNDIQAVVNNVVQVPNDAYTISGTTITFTSAPSSGTNNVYVRYLSTTTQAITPSQNTVSWNTLDSNVQGDLGISFKNRIINGNMVIDQRNAGASVTINSSAYTYPVDRFAGFGESTDGVFTLQQSSVAPTGFTNSLLATVTTADASIGGSQRYFVRQVIEGYNVADLGFGTATASTVTLSFWVRSSLTGTFGGSFMNENFDRAYPFTYTISSANTWEKKSVTITGDTSGTWVKTNGAGLVVIFSIGAGVLRVGTAGAWQTPSQALFGATGQTNIIATNGATWYITGVQLEVGTQATTFTTAGGSYGAELALCQRYYYKKGPQSSSDVRYGIGFSGSGSTTTAYINVTLPVNMRTGPTSVDWGSTLAVWKGGTNFQVTAISIYSSGSGMTDCLLQCTSSGLTGEEAYQLVAWSSGNAFLALGAEL